MPVTDPTEEKPEPEMPDEPIDLPITDPIDEKPEPEPVLVPEFSLYDYEFQPEDDQICRDLFLELESLHMDTLANDEENKAELDSLYSDIRSAFEMSNMQIVDNPEFLAWVLAFSMSNPLEPIPPQIRIPPVEGVNAALQSSFGAMPITTNDALGAALT